MYIGALILAERYTVYASSLTENILRQCTLPQGGDVVCILYMWEVTGYFYRAQQPVLWSGTSITILAQQVSQYNA
jgi:hypothetical protein